MIGYREGGQVVKHVYAFKSQRVKDNWLRTLRFARTKLCKDKINATRHQSLKYYWLFLVAIASPNGLTWYLSSDQYEEEESVVVHDRRLPLYLSSHRIPEVHENISVRECNTGIVQCIKGTKKCTTVFVCVFFCPSVVISSLCAL